MRAENVNAKIAQAATVANRPRRSLCQNQDVIDDQNFFGSCLYWFLVVPRRRKWLRVLGAARTETAPPVRPLPPPPPPGEKKNGSSAKVENLNGKNVTVWYGTNRTRSDPFSWENPYSSNRDQDLEFGTCTVKIPKSHKRGSLGSWTYYLTGRDEPIGLSAQRPWQRQRFGPSLSKISNYFRVPTVGSLFSFTDLTTAFKTQQ